MNIMLFSALTLSLSLISVATAWNDPEQEASTFVRNKLERERTILFCDDDSSFTALLKRGGAQLTLIEMKGGRFSVEPVTLSQADKLNGVQWQGAVRYYVDALRDRTLKVTEERKSNGWSEWGEWYESYSEGRKAAFVAARVRLKHGQWEYMASRVGPGFPGVGSSTALYGELFRDFRTITCELIRNNESGGNPFAEPGE